MATDCCSPTTQRRPLAALDANSGARPKRPFELAGGIGGVKSGDDDTVVVKRMCCRPQDSAAGPSAPARLLSLSPAPSSVFDGDASRSTIMTEPELASPRPAPGRIMTREQARQRAEILKLRLGLASYKLRTGQTDLPLDELQRRLLPASYSPSAAPPSRDGEQPVDSSGTEESDASPPQPQASCAVQPVTPPQRRQRRDGSRDFDDDGDDGRLTSSALKGGAVSGLLCLARGSA